MLAKHDIFNHLVISALVLDDLVVGALDIQKEK